jgi:large subunit ribosomal protein L13
MKTYSARPDDIDQKWHLIDAEGQTMGRLATQIADLIRGKHKPMYTPHMDCGDFVVVINASKIKVSGNKFEDKIYYHHTGYVGNLKKISFRDLLAKDPTAPLEKAVWGMLPHNKLGRAQMKKLKLHAGAEHPHVAQQPEPFVKQEMVN